MPNYENETCGSCRYCREKMTDTARHETCLHPDTAGCEWPDLSDQCELFTPSLECRKVRALESIDRKFNPPPIVRDELSAHVKEMIAAERACVVCGGDGVVNVDCGCFSMDGSDRACEDCNGDGTIEVECPECSE